MNQVITKSSECNVFVIGNCRLCGAVVTQAENYTLICTTSVLTPEPFVYGCACTDGDGNRAIRFLSDDHATTIERLEEQLGQLSKTVDDFGSFREEIMNTQPIQELDTPFCKPVEMKKKRWWHW